MIGMSSSWLAVKGLSIRESIEKVFELGFGLVEVGAAHKYEDHAVETLLELRKKYPDKHFTLHAMFPHFKNGSYALNLADPKEQDRTLKVVKKMFDMSERIGATMLGIHGGYAGEAKWVEGKSGFERLMIRAPIPSKVAERNMKLILEDLVNIAEERSIKLAIEISPPDSASPIMTTPDSFEWMFSGFESKQLGLLLDVGHLHLAANEKGYNPYEFIKKFKGNIFEVHLHDCKDGMDHCAVGTGEIDFDKYFKTIGRDILEKVPIVFEYNNSVTEEQMIEGKALIEKNLAGK